MQETDFGLAKRLESPLAADADALPAAEKSTSQQSPFIARLDPPT